MTTTFTVSHKFQKELNRINSYIQEVAEASNLLSLSTSYHRGSGFIIGLTHVLYTDEVDFDAIHKELTEIYHVRKWELMNSEEDDNQKWFGNCVKEEDK